MIKKFRIFEQLNISDIDPYGEEDWNDDNDTLIIQLAKKQNKPLDQIEILDCNNNLLTSLEGIENLTNLEKLYCYNNRFTDEYKNYLKSLKIKDLRI